MAPTVCPAAPFEHVCASTCKEAVPFVCLLLHPYIRGLRVRVRRPRHTQQGGREPHAARSKTEQEEEAPRVEHPVKGWICGHVVGWSIPVVRSIVHAGVTRPNPPPKWKRPAHLARRAVYKPRSGHAAKPAPGTRHRADPCIVQTHPRAFWCMRHARVHAHASRVQPPTRSTCMHVCRAWLTECARPPAAGGHCRHDGSQWALLPGQ